MDFEIILTERLKLRKLNPNVYHYIFNHFPKIELKIFLGLFTDAEVDHEIEKFSKGTSTFNRSFVYFQIIDKFTDKIIGWCGFHTWYLDHNRAEIGYALTDNAEKSKGLMTEAMTAILKYGFKEMKLHRIEAFIGSENVPSLKLIAKFNFKKEGVLREHYFNNNKMEDSVVFSLLKDEFVIQ